MLLTAAIALAGAAAYTALPVSALPQNDYPTISVSASLPGASPDTMASAVATPLERQLGRIAAVTEMTSASSLGGTTVTLQFDLDRNIDAAARDVQAAINAARGYLPSNLPGNPSYKKVNPAEIPIFELSLTSRALDRGQMYDAASTIILQKLSQIRGVGQVVAAGSALPGVRVELNPTILNKYGIGLEDVRGVLNGANANVPKGVFVNNDRAWGVASSDQIFKAADYKSLIVSWRGGAPIRVSDLGDVVDSVEDLRNAGYANGKSSVIVSVYRQPGANIIETIDRIREALPQIHAAIPQAIDLNVTQDRSLTIRTSVHDVSITLFSSVLLVILVVFVFLRSLRATLIPSVVVPVSLIGTFGVMYLCRFSVDNLSLMALTIATGFVVDDAIVVIENITRYLEQGMTPMRAALRGAEEVGFTVLTISISLIAVFIPLLMMGGIVGRLFREFSVVLAVAIAVSLLVSLTTTPMMCAYLLRNRASHGWLYRITERAFDKLVEGYDWTLQRVLEHPSLTLAVLLAVIGLNVELFINIPKGFFPQQDIGRMSGTILADQDSSFQSMQARLLQAVNIIGADPGVETITGSTGGSGGGGKTINQANFNVQLKLLEDRKASVYEIIDRLRPKLNAIRGATVSLQASQDVKIGAKSAAALYQFTMRGDNLEDLTRWGRPVLEALRRVPIITDASSDQQNSGLQSWVQYDRATAARFGISSQLIDNVLYDAFGQRQVSTMYASLNQYHVVMEAAPRFWQNSDFLSQIYVRSPGGSSVPLSAFASFGPATAPLAVNHQGLSPAVTISFNLVTGVSLGDAVDAINKTTAAMGMPSTIHTSFAGTAAAYEKSLANEPILIAAALIAVYIVLGVLYESFLHPITIISTLPSAGVGALLALMYWKLDLDLIAMIGIILLIGIVKKNAIMMIDFAIAAERAEGLSPAVAIYQACLMRFRPILMTTMSALLGAVPLAFGTGLGRELRRPLGITITGGLIVSQLLTLYTTPVVYLALDSLRLRFSRGNEPVGTESRVHNFV